MKYFPLVLLSILTTSSCKDENTATTTSSPNLNSENHVFKVYKTTNYLYGKFYREEYDTIKTSTRNVDIHLFRKHFHHPYHLPDTLISGQHKDTVVTVWSNPGKENYESNWSHTYTYDSLGRVTNYAYLSCIVCSSLPFDCFLTYDKSGRISSIENIVGMEENYKIYFNETGDIKQLDEYSSGELEMSVSLIK